MDKQTLGRFEEYRGQFIKVEGKRFYVPKKKQEDLFFGTVIQNMCFEKQVAEGWQVVALDVCIEYGMPVQTDGLLAINPAIEEVLVCDEGTNRKIGKSASRLQIEICTDDDFDDEDLDDDEDFEEEDDEDEFDDEDDEEDERKNN
jgi:hypothetical protein